ncbi:MDR family MFS transporter [Lacicoccus qingdaonensis]|uniref:Drug resistance transporter, EmrB/QacA subfamily n=1 Tax=Lacicoccus qingdaonensis TaxID=576118 RepID=A0A1G9FI20_9BACL|nr:MDR family MFS transporter [Salinicoccus qingdaonensis]SDK88040.1 drug resistance transporter, EmrB/QacA subfamily [Salinicoccus qingdaonensis]
MSNSDSFDFKKNLPLLVVLLSGAFVTILNQTLLGTALPPIMNDLNLSGSTAQWLQSIFMLVNGIMIPVTAFLIDKFTTRRLFLTAMGLFTLGTLLCAIAPSFSILMAGRVLQASGAGIMMPLMQTILFLSFPVNRRGTAMGLFGLIIAFAPAIGPSLSGFLVDQFPWRSVFIVVLPIAVIDIIAAYFLLRNVTELKNPKVDVTSIILSTLGFGGILYGFSVAGDTGWLSWQVLLTVIGGGLILYFFITRQLKLKEPLLEFRVFQNKTFSLATALGMVVFAAMIGTNVILPLYMQNMAGFSALESGLVLLPGAIIMGFSSPITGYLFDRFGGKWLARIGMFLLAVTTFGFIDLSAETSFSYLATMHALRMMSISMVMMPMTTLALNQLPNDLISHGTAVNNTFRQVSGAIGTAILVTVMSTAAIPSDGVEGTIHGVNVSFIVAGVASFLGFILSFRLKEEVKPGD